MRAKEFVSEIRIHNLDKVNIIFQKGRYGVPYVVARDVPKDKLDILLRALPKRYPNVKPKDLSFRDVENPYGEKISEKINHDITQGQWRAEKLVALPNGSQVILRARNTSDITPPQFVVDVYRPEDTAKSIAHFRFLVLDWEPPKTGWFAKKSKKDPYVIGGNVRVSNEHQRRGIARAVYSWIKSLGNNVKPSSTRTPAGMSMWNSFERNPLEENKDAIKFDIHTPDDFEHSFKISLTVHGKNVGQFSFVRHADTDDVNNEVEVDSRFLNQGYGKLLLLKAIDIANNHGLDFQQDIRGITPAQQRVYDSLESTGHIVSPGQGFWFLTPEGEHELKMLDKQGVAENFADGKGPGRPGDSQRHGIPKHATMAELEKASHAKGRKGQLARWQLNMRRGHKK